MLLSLTKVHPFHAMTCKLMSQFNVLAILPEKLKSLHCSKLIRSLYIFIFYNNAILEFVSKKKKRQSILSTALLFSDFDANTIVQKDAITLLRSIRMSP